MATAARSVMSRRKQKQDPVLRLARTLLPAAQVRKGDHAIVDIANRTEADQRHMVRSKETTTLKRRTHLEKLKDRGVINQRQLDLCEWYFRIHEEGFGTTCHISNYGSAGGSAPGSMDLLAKTRDQFIARELYREARASISPMLIHLFERVVIGQTHIGDGETWRRKSALKHTFRLAVDQLDRACGHLAGGE
jgi:hypothetical protein